MRKVGGGFLSVSVFLGAFRDGGKKGVFWWSGSEVAEGMGCDAGVWRRGLFVQGVDREWEVS